MSRAGEKLYGNCYGPEADRLEREGRRIFWRTAMLVAAIVIIGGSALFGFG